MSNLGENSMKRAGLEGVVQRDRDGMDWRPIMPEPDVASLLADHPVAEALDDGNYAFCRNSARQLHAASTGISSSFT